MASLLDTNVVSQLTKEVPHRGVSQWLLTLNSQEMYLSIVSLAEIRYGIETMDAGRKRDRLAFWLESDLPRMFSGRLLPVDERVANEAGRMLARLKANSRRPDVADSLIAATANVHKLKLATLNRNDFQGLPVELVIF